MSVQLLSFEEVQNFVTKKELQDLESEMKADSLFATIEPGLEHPYVVIRGKAISIFHLLILIGKQ
jgi:hypothetical protein